MTKLCYFYLGNTFSKALILVIFSAFPYLSRFTWFKICFSWGGLNLLVQDTQLQGYRFKVILKWTGNSMFWKLTLSMMEYCIARTFRCISLNGWMRKRLITSQPRHFTPPYQRCRLILPRYSKLTAINWPNRVICSIAHL